MAQKNSAVGTTGEEEKFKCDMNSSLSARINHFLCKMMCSDLLSKQDIGAKAVGWSGLSLSLCRGMHPLSLSSEEQKLLVWSLSFSLPLPQPSLCMHPLSLSSEE